MCPRIELACVKNEGDIGGASPQQKCRMVVASDQGIIEMHHTHAYMLEFLDTYTYLSIYRCTYQLPSICIELVPMRPTFCAWRMLPPITGETRRWDANHGRSEKVGGHAPDSVLEKCSLLTIGRRPLRLRGRQLRVRPARRGARGAGVKACAAGTHPRRASLRKPVNRRGGHDGCWNEGLHGHLKRTQREGQRCFGAEGYGMGNSKKATERFGFNAVFEALSMVFLCRVLV